MNTISNNKNVKVSIITPVYNPKEEHLIECINSLVNQTLDNVEIILIDNAALYSNPEIIKDFANRYSQIRVIKFEQNQGFAKACNEGLKIAGGEYIQIVDSDDVIRRDACEILYKKAKKYDSDLIFFGAREYNDKTKQHEYTDWYSLNFFPIKLTYSPKTSKECVDFMFNSPLQDWNKFVKRELIYNYDNFFEEKLGYVLPDCVYSIKNMINAKRIMLEKAHLYDYRINISSSVVKGYSKKECPYIDAPIIFSQKLDEILTQCEGEIYADKILKISLMHLFGYYSLVHKANKNLLYSLMHDYLKNTQNPYMTKSILKKIGYYKQIKDFRKYNYTFYNIMRFIYRYEKRIDGKRINILGFNVYRERYADFKIQRRYLGFIKTSEPDMRATVSFIINKVTMNLQDLLLDENGKIKSINK